MDNKGVRESQTKMCERLQVISHATRGVCCIDMRVIANKNKIVLATGSCDHKVRLYSSSLTHSPTNFRLQSYVTHKDDVYAVEYDVSGSLLLSADYTGVLIVWDVRNISHPQQMKSFTHPNTVMSAHWSRNGDTIISACRDNTIRVFDKNLTCKKFDVPCKGSLWAMMLSDNMIIAGDTEGWLYQLELKNPSHVISQRKTHNGAVSGLNGVDVLDDGICVSGGYNDHTLCVWDMKTNKVKKLKHPNSVVAVHVPLKVSHLFMTTCRDGCVRMYDQNCNPSRVLFTLKTSCLPSCAAFSIVPMQQCSLFVVGCEDGYCDVYRCSLVPVHKVCNA